MERQRGEHRAVDDQHVVWSGGFGYADAAMGRPATAETVYRVGSITKLVTAAEILVLADRHRLDLDQPVADLVPGFSPAQSLRRIADDDSAVATGAPFDPADRLCGMWGSHPETLATLVDALHEEYLVSPPQTKYKYSNLDYALLGRIVEVADGVSLRDLLRAGPT